MRRVILFILLGCLFESVSAQTAKTEIRRNVRLSAGSQLAYLGPQQCQSPAPFGMKPFYISHYGCQGSHYLSSAETYSHPYDVLRLADSLKLLTPRGMSVLARLATIRQDAIRRLGELTPLGATQLRQIARRMYERFPEVFEGDATVDARSTTVVSSILSMENTLQQLLVLNPRLKVSHEATQRDMYYMNQGDSLLWRRLVSEEVAAPLHEFCQRYDCSQAVLGRLVSDVGTMAARTDVQGFGLALFRVASGIQNTELCKRITLYDVFTDEEVYENWLNENARSYCNYGFCPLNGGQQPFSQRNLLRRIIHEADSCLRMEKPGASLRFGHETVVLPLVCLLSLDSYGQTIADFEQLDDRGWRNYKVFPMAANIQFVFYRKHAQDQDVLFKVLLNEDEVALPLPSGMAPYYHWRDFKERYMALIDSYVEKEPTR